MVEVSKKWARPKNWWRERQLSGLTYVTCTKAKCQKELVRFCEKEIPGPFSLFCLIFCVQGFPGSVAALARKKKSTLQ